MVLMASVRKTINEMVSKRLTVREKDRDTNIEIH